MNPVISFQIIMNHLLKDVLVKDGIRYEQWTEKPPIQEIPSTLVTTFLICLCGKEHPHYEQAGTILSEFGRDRRWKEAADFFQRGAKRIPEEIEEAAVSDVQFADTLEHLSVRLIRGEELRVQDLWSAFFPEGVGLFSERDRERKIHQLRQKRTVTVEKPDPRPITHPAREILFTSNILLAPPLSNKEDYWHLPVELKPPARQVLREKQLFWYDHPIPLGIDPDKNEALYGIRGLEKMMAYEKTHGTIDKQERLTVVLSTSTTHRGLHNLVRPYFKDLFEKHGNLLHTNLFIFSEDATDEIFRQVLLPLQKKFFPEADVGGLREVFGVDGEYGRHYSFLKAIGAFWQVFIDPQIKATFKIDLDQVFPEEELEAETGSTALQLLSSAVWGAKGRDADGHLVELGMIAGALVNARDIGRGLFTADVPFPRQVQPEFDERIFYSRLPQAQSTAAEMMTRYGSAGHPDGKKQVIQRFHVTGGTNGILVEALRRFRPFTPTIMGRAEDQAYLLSVLWKGTPSLRYYHASGLFMRHDKDTFAREAIEAAAEGKIIGDYLRILLFSVYARALPWPVKDIMDQVDPFTGCFISGIPVTVVLLRMALRYFRMTQEDGSERAIAFLRQAVGRLKPFIEQPDNGQTWIKKVFEREQSAWHLYYDILQRAEEELKKGDKWLQSIRQAARKIVEENRITVDHDK